MENRICLLGLGREAKTLPEDLNPKALESYISSEVSYSRWMPGLEKCYREAITGTNPLWGASGEKPKVISNEDTGYICRGFPYNSNRSMEELSLALHVSGKETQNNCFACPFSYKTKETEENTLTREQIILKLVAHGHSDLIKDPSIEGTFSQDELWRAY